MRARLLSVVLALTVLITGLATAVGVLVAVALALRAQLPMAGMEKASTGTARSRAMGATADTDGPNRGPTITSAPWDKSCCTAAA